MYFLEPVLLNKKLSCYPNKATGEALSFDLGYHHTIVAPEKAARYRMNTYPICDPSPERSAERSLATSQKSRRHNRSFVWTEAMSGMIFMTVQNYNYTSIR